MSTNTYRWGQGDMRYKMVENGARRQLDAMSSIPRAHVVKSKN